MPGLYGIASSDPNSSLPDTSPMFSELSYARAVVNESYRHEGIAMGCVNLGTGGQRAHYESPQAVVLFFGYLTRPVIPPGADASNPSAAARFIHDIFLSRGEKALEEISGAYALAIWDAGTQTLLLANDRLGLRPIYYGEHAGIFRFASEVKGILSDPTFPRRLNKHAIAEFFQVNFIMGEKTFFEDIHLLPPASILRFHYGQYHISKYWEIPFPVHYLKHTDQFYDDLIFDALNTAVKRMVRPGLRYGLSLSGGLDSRWIAALLANTHPASLAFTLHTPGSDDTSPASAVAKITGLQHYIWEISPTLVADLGEIYAYVVDGMDSMWHMDEFPLTTRVGNYVDVSVGGFLGDGLFGYEINPLSAYLRKQDAARYRRWRTRAIHPSQSLMAQVFRDDMGKDFILLAMDSLDKAYAESPGERGFQAIQYYDLLQAERRYANIAQLAKLSFVDIYHPIADEDVILAALQLPPDQLMFERAYRRAMATHLPDMARIPWTFTLTPPTISVMGILLKKTAQMTLGKYLRNSSLGNHPLIRQRRYFSDHTKWSRGSLQQFIYKSLLSPEMESLGIFNMQGLKKVIQDHFDGTSICTTFIGISLSLSMWAHMFYCPSTPVRPSALDQDAWKRIST